MPGSEFHPALIPARRNGSWEAEGQPGAAEGTEMLKQAAKLSKGVSDGT